MLNFTGHDDVSNWLAGADNPFETITLTAFTKLQGQS